ncbi:ATP-dependent DNA ligase [Variovorax sp. ZT4R33]|uniref:ATP-dependent DNA ligase n=1 Tax=Variovorax sp. ZT4R33 TaxID=3443743 RepID=UPI003F46E61B
MRSAPWQKDGAPTARWLARRAVRRCFHPAMALDAPLPASFAPVEPMLAKIADTLSPGDFLYEPKWDGFRAIVHRSDDGVVIQSRDSRPLDRYFPELHALFLSALPGDCTLDGEIVIAGARGLDFDALQQRVHPAASRIARLAHETPASFVAFDLLRLGGEDLMPRPQRERRLLLEALLADIGPPIHLTPMTTDRALAEHWLADFEGAGLDGVMAKPADAPYQPGRRAMLKIKHVRSADCVVAGFRWQAILGLAVPTPMQSVTAPPSACPARAAAGAAARTCRGNRCASSVCAK